MAFALFASAQTGQEDTNDKSTRYASYLDAYVVATNSPVAFKIAPGSTQYSKAYIEDLIRYKARQEGLNEELMAAIAYCESGYQQKWNYLHDTDPDYYTAYGPFQVIKGHQDRFGIDRMTLEGNIELAFKLYEEQGLKPWELSKNCILSEVRRTDG